MRERHMPDVVDRTFYDRHLLPPIQRPAPQGSRHHQALDQHEHTLADFSHRLRSGRRSYSMLLECAQSHLAHGNLGLALVECEIAAQDVPIDDTRVYQLRGLILFMIGDLYGALCDLSRAIDVGAPAAELYLQRGLVYQALGDHRSACEDLDEFARRYTADGAVAQRELAGPNLVAAQAVPAA